MRIIGLGLEIACKRARDVAREVGVENGCALPAPEVAGIPKRIEG